MDFKKQLIDLAAQRTAALNKAESALGAKDNASYDAAMQEVTNINADITRTQTLLKEQERQMDAYVPSAAEVLDMAESRADTLRRGGTINFTAAEVRRGIRNATTVATGTVVEPTGAGANVRDPLGNGYSSIVDQVYVQDLTGLGSFEEPYTISELDAQGGSVASTAGQARTASTDPTFGIAQIKPFDVTVTSYVDRNINRLSPANYYAKIQGMAMRAMKRKLAGIIVKGDGQTTNDMFGVYTAKNKAGSAISATAAISALDENLIDTLYFEYGSDSEIGANARLFLSKSDLKALGKIRNTNKERVFKVIPDPSNPNIGVIEDGGLAVPYTICPDANAWSGSTKGSTAINTMFYGDPINYELGLFGDYSIRLDESIKGVERMYTILGDCMAGGNVIVDKGFVIGTL